ncbi:OsmC family peroxiredoxin [Mycolicibacterium sp. 050158]|jgi:lipoyl-dependent peroxiredoxin|uniref:OsmC family peroxiredoxin n=1 Tax=Mycolicibacterium sp. 050158 TaxID=3090602 RepID=UPI00299CF1FF|nr:OsmC family peroxiredoxin [Mycolicibacterium sp. 050158]MDX1888080.1 OsmC family peroxiredoxin [Mycolicibacterium sp. 050158]
MSTRVSTVEWHGSLVGGSGSIELTSSGQASFGYSLATRAADEASTTSPEELLAAAYASCYAMQLSALLNPGPDDELDLHVEAIVTQGGPEIDFGISGIALMVRGRGIDMSNERFVELAQTASSVCPIGRALSSVEVGVDAALQ